MKTLEKIDLSTICLCKAWLELVKAPQAGTIKIAFHKGDSYLIVRTDDPSLGNEASFSSVYIVHIRLTLNLKQSNSVTLVPHLDNYKSSSLERKVKRIC